MFADRYIRRVERRGCGWRLRRTDEVWPTSAAGDAAQPAARQLRQHRRRHDRRLHPDILQRQIDDRGRDTRGTAATVGGGARGIRRSKTAAERPPAKHAIYLQPKRHSVDVGRHGDDCVNRPASSAVQPHNHSSEPYVILQSRLWQQMLNDDFSQTGDRGINWLNYYNLANNG